MTPKDRERKRLAAVWRESGGNAVARARLRFAETYLAKRSATMTPTEARALAKYRDIAMPDGIRDALRSAADQLDAQQKRIDVMAIEAMRRTEDCGNLMIELGAKQKQLDAQKAEIERLKAPPKAQSYCTHCGQYSSICQGGC